jgi:demethylmenaquinone methyltransferase/2-methoxy-6-polyprenyl-1,4-benzoquinol methylase
VLELAAIGPRDRVLDLASGTGDLAIAARPLASGVVALDLVPGMVALARRKPAARDIAFVVGDMTHLPVPDASIDVVLTGYGLRNVPRLDRAVAEIARVLRPGGRFVSLDFNRPAHPGLRAAYLTYLRLVGSVVGFVLHRDPDTYRYIPESLARYPGAPAVVGLLVANGLTDARWVRVLGGLMAVHVATRDRISSSTCSSPARSASS